MGETVGELSSYSIPVRFVSWVLPKGIDTLETHWGLRPRFQLVKRHSRSSRVAPPRRNCATQSSHHHILFVPKLLGLSALSLPI